MYSQFNDNGDGTLSRVGTHSHVRPIVVSQRVRPASQMEPRAEQQPVGYKPVSAVSATQGISGSPHVQPPQPSVTTLQHTSAAAAAAAANKIAMWDYIKTFLTQGLRNQGVPNTGKAAMFFEVPRVRDVRWNEALEQRNPDVPKRASHLAALLIQVTGKEASSPCDFCRSGRGLYEGCVLVNSTATPDMHVAYEGCANCVSSPSRATCSHSHRARQRFARLFPHLNYDRVATELPSKLYKPRPAMMWTQGAVAASTATAATATATATTATVAGARGEKTDKMRDLPAHTRGSPDTDGEETLQRRDKSAAIIRRSGRIAEYGGESAPAPLYGIKSSSSSSISSSSVALARTAAHQKRDSPLLVAGDTQPALEMEDWEVAPGRVQAATNESKCWHCPFSVSRFPFLVPTTRVLHSMLTHQQTLPFQMRTSRPAKWSPSTTICRTASRWCGPVRRPHLLPTHGPRGRARWRRASCASPWATRRLSWAHTACFWWRRASRFPSKIGCTLTRICISLRCTTSDDVGLRGRFCSLLLLVSHFRGFFFFLFHSVTPWCICLFNIPLFFIFIECFLGKLSVTASYATDQWSVFFFSVFVLISCIRLVRLSRLVSASFNPASSVVYTQPSPSPENARVAASSAVCCWPIHSGIVLR